MDESARLLTIGQLAGYAGVTIKAVRHYHERGLLPEPDRDASGYRRYDARDAITLVKIKTLADAGVPLARVAELLAADAEQLHTAVAEIDRALEARIEKLRRARANVARLEAGDRLFVPARCDEYLNGLRALGVSERTVTTERDVWILLAASAPETAERWVTEKLALLDDAEFAAIYRAYDEAFDWDPDDPRLVALADRTKRWLAKQPPPAARNARGAGADAGIANADAGAGAGAGADEDAGDADLSIAALAAASVAAESPAWQRLGQLMR